MATYKLIQRQQLASGATGVTFSSFSGYTHLVLKVVGRTGRTNAIGDDMLVRLNSDANTNYGYHWAYCFATSSGASLLADYSTPQDKMYIGPAPAPGTSPTTTPSTQYGGGEFYIINYAGSTYKPVGGTIENPGMTDTPVGATNSAVLQANLYSSTSAITSIYIYNGTGTNFQAGCSFALYGIA